MEQPYIIDNEIKIKDLIKNYSKKHNTEILIDEYKLFVLGN